MNKMISFVKYIKQLQKKKTGTKYGRKQQQRKPNT